MERHLEARHLSAARGDGLPGHRDLDGVADDDGCPEPDVAATVVVVQPAAGDKDGDGIKDNVDRCPNMREDGADGDGCPGKDADHDKIPNTKDKCPEEPEDWDSVQDDDGCPEKD